MVLTYQQKLDADRQQIALIRKQYEEQWARSQQQSAPQKPPLEQAEDYHAGQSVPAERKRDDTGNRIVALGILLIFIGIAGFVALLITNPVACMARTASQAFGTSSGNTQPGIIDGDRLEELKLRLDRLESLVLQLPEKLVATEKPKKEPSPLEVLFAVLGVIVVLGVPVTYICKSGEAEKRRKKAEQQRQLVEAVAKRLAAEFKVDPRPLGTEKESGSEDEGDVSFENMDMSADETAH